MVAVDHRSCPANEKELHVARWGQTNNPVGKTSHHDGWTVVQDKSSHTQSNGHDRTILR